MGTFPLPLPKEVEEGYYNDTLGFLVENAADYAAWAIETWYPSPSIYIDGFQYLLDGEGKPPSITKNHSSSFNSFKKITMKENGELRDYPLYFIANKIHNKIIPPPGFFPPTEEKWGREIKVEEGMEEKWGMPPLEEELRDAMKDEWEISREVQNEGMKEEWELEEEKSREVEGMDIEEKGIAYTPPPDVSIYYKYKKERKIKKQLKIITIEGTIGTGKTTLLKNLDLSKYNGKVDILYEPHEKFNTFLNYKPLDLFYTNPKENALICQMHIFDVCRQELENKLNKISPNCEILLTDRSILSPIIFNNTLLDMKFLTKYQYDFIIEHINQNIMKMEKFFHVVKPTAYFYLTTNIPVSVENIENRNFSKENKFPLLKCYLHKLSKHMIQFMTALEEKRNTIIFWEEKLDLKDRLYDLHKFLEHFLNK